MLSKSQISLRLVVHMMTTVSILFVILYLLKIDFLKISIGELKIEPLIISLALLLAGFILSVLNWKYLLRLTGYSLRSSQCLYSVGMSVFAKYIPGKIWSALGRASLVAQFGVPMKHALLISVFLQVVFITCGLTLGLIGLSVSQRFGLVNLGVYILVAILLISIILPKIRQTLLGIMGKLFKKDIKPISIGVGASLKVLALFFVQWCCWAFGFYFLSRALLHGDIPILSTSFAFPLSVCLGMLSAISPGGIGVREGALVGALGIIGLSLSDATTISVLARIWFLIGEAFVFLEALIMRKIERVNMDSSRSANHIAQ